MTSIIDDFEAIRAGMSGAEPAESAAAPWPARDATATIYAGVRILLDPVFADTYTGELRERIIRLRDEADKIRENSDTPPAVAEEAQP
jgi:hypothetical protein